MNRMLTLPASPSRDDVLSFLATSSSYGNLGLFVGAGFSKAVLNEDRKIALSWSELLEKAAARMSVDYLGLEKTGVSFPEIASTICARHSIDHHLEYEDSLKSIKRELASLTSWYPSGKQRERYSTLLASLEPAWIITTNYDLVLESLLTGKSIPLGPNDSLSAPKGIVPVFHLHGVRTNPDEIIIAQEDYVALFRPNQYRQIKLALTIKESVTLLVGYGLGDVNVLTALDWSRNVFVSDQRNYPNDVVQLLRKNTPCTEPYRDTNGIVIVEAASIHAFFEEFLVVKHELQDLELKEAKRLTRLAKKLDSPDDGMIGRFIDDEVFRKRMLTLLSRFSIHLAGGFVSFIEKCMDETWQRSAPYGAFGGYSQNLAIIIDILTTFPIERIPPALFQSVAYGLERVAYFVGSEPGKSWVADELWSTRKSELSVGVVKELRNVADQYGYAQLDELLDSIL